MNLKSRLLGVGAAAVLSLSMATGIVSADDASVKVHLKPDVCSASLTQSTVNFGSWKWNDETQAYEVNGGADSRSIDGKVRVEYFGDTCDIAFGLEGNQLTGAGTNVIPGSRLTLDLGGYGTYGLGSSHTFASPRIDVAGTLDLDTTGLNVQPDEYQGTLKFIVGNAL